MFSFRSSDRPERDPQAQLLFHADGELLVVRGEEAWNLHGLSRSTLEQLMTLVDGRRTVDEICDRMGGDRSSTLQLLEVLDGMLLRGGSERFSANGSRPAGEPSPASISVAVLGNGHLGAAIFEELAQLSSMEVELIEVNAFASCQEPSFLEAAQARAPGSPDVRPTPSPLASAVVDVMTSSELRGIFARHQVVVGALEGMRYRALLEINEAALAEGVPCILARVDGEEIVLGPSLVGTQSACFGCSVLVTTLASHPDRGKAAEYVALLSTQRLPPGPLLHAAARQVKDEIQRIGVDPLLAGRLLRLSREDARLMSLPTEESCPFCGPARHPLSERASTLMRRSRVSISLNQDRRAEAEVRGTPATGDTPYRTVGILGGGTAGYLTALALRTRRPELSVTLIESSQIPIIGVGEATTPRLLEFLHSKAGLDVVDFYRRVLPTWKMGIKFFWGLPGDYTFSGAFQFASLLEPMVYRGNLETYSLGCALMEQNRVPIFANPDGTVTSFLHRIAWAYHLDNVRFVRYLTEEALRLGVERLDRVIADAELSADGESIECLVDQEGEKHRFDLYVDASGFRSFLLEKKMGSKFISYDSSLFTDSAVCADVPHGGVIKPYTTAESMDSGWCWNIPFQEADHRGYVFSSAFCTPEQAADEMRRKNPGMSSDPRLIQFRSGRHADFWRGNVLAVGNAYAFVEPLESTGLEMLTIELDLVIDHFPASQRDEGIKRALSDKLGRMWDDLRGLLAIHYRFNRKFDTDFWRECRASTVLASAEARVALFVDRAPLSHSRALLRANDPVSDFFSQDYIYDVLLCGQQVPATYLQPIESRASLERRRRHYQQAASWAIPQAEALRMLSESPDALVSVFDNPESWIQLKRY
jgi:tryptophan 7-halogenase